MPEKSMSHKAYMFSLYKRAPNLSESYLRTARIEKFFPILNRRLREGVVVDLGCGIGTYTKLICAKKVIGIDFSLERLKAAKKNCSSRCNFLLADMECLPFKKRTIDSFFSFCSVYALMPESQSKLFKDLYSMLKKNGTILLIEPNRLNPFRRENAPIYPLYKGEVKRRLRETGFKNIDIKSYDFIPHSFLVKGGTSLKFFGFLEKLLEFLRIPFSGALAIYAEK